MIGECLECKRTSSMYKRGLCGRCGRTPSILKKYPKKKPGTKNDRVRECVRCQKKKFIKARRLCDACYKAFGRAYPPVRKVGVRRRGVENDNATMAEIEQMIAEQMRCLPDWWRHDEKMMQAGNIDK